MVVTEHNQQHIAKIRTYDFPDSVSFNGNLLDENETNDENEQCQSYAKMALLHFSHFCTINDIKNQVDS